MKIEELEKAAFRKKQPENLDFMDQKMYWALRDIYFLYERNELTLDQAKTAKAELLESYRDARAAYESYIRGKTAISLLHTSSNAECREIARQMEELFR